MGLRYLFFRIYYALITKLDWQKQTFPVNPARIFFISLEEWRSNTPPFFFYGKNIHNLPKNKSEALKKSFDEIKQGRFTFFSKLKFDLGANYDWVTNPSTGYKYSIDKHWSEIQDLSKEAGDIKFVWEKARFSYLYDVIRYDYHFEDDQAKFVLDEIENFIDNNPINQGPNYKCSQEISLRVFNWTFALYYYKDSIHLTNELFGKIMNAIYWKIHHVYHNIHFSRIAVRNNHAITETLMLYLSAKLFPFMLDTKKWSVKGKKWFEQEVAYQIYEDGTFLQFSMNYHRVVVQLLTWGIQLAKLNNDSFDKVVYKRAQKSLEFLDACSDPVTGKLPNYGSNDGALFFKLTDNNYRNYRSQLDSLRAVLKNHIYFDTESVCWYGVTSVEKIQYKTLRHINKFEKGGYYILQEEKTKTFIRCGAYKDRPFQSDNLHVDIWVDGVNILRDSGSYKYNTEKENINYFTGCEGHNTVSIAKTDQMLKGGRFIWYNWVKKVKASLQQNNKEFEFLGTIDAFKHLGSNIRHHRKIIKKVAENNWEFEDKIENKGQEAMYQYWHLHPEYKDKITIKAKDALGKEITPIIEEKWFSGYYGVKEKSIRLTFVTQEDTFNTTISIQL
ncbi:MAG: heparinase [Kordia sp.]|nr:MAG: heparinase [Kordia sp.]